MNPKAVVKHYGSVREMANALGFTTAAVYYWLEKERIPYNSQRLIEIDTKGKFKAKRDKYGKAL